MVRTSACLSLGDKLEDGTESRSMVGPLDYGLINYNSRCVLYQEIRDWFEDKKEDNEIISLVKNKLDLSPAEAKYLCNKLFKERDKGDIWDKSFESEKKYIAPFNP